MSGNDVNGKLDTLIAKVENIETLLVGDVKNTGKVGVLERIRKIEKSHSGERYCCNILTYSVSKPIR
jgi:hypothetical protein